MAMPIYLLAPLVFCGIVIVVLLVRLFFNKKPRELVGIEDIEAIFHLEFPERQINDPIWIGSDRRSALFGILGSPDALGFVRGMGHHWVSRLISIDQISKIDRAGGKQIAIHLSEFANPQIRIRFDKAEMADRLQARLQEMMGAKVREGARKP